MMKPGDIVKVVRQPPDLPAHIVGEVCFIEEMNEGYASIQSLKSDGSTGGAGCVPIDCLAPESDAVWSTAKAMYDARVDKLVAESKAFNERLQAKKNELANLYGITVDDVDRIFQTLTEEYNRYRY